MIGTSGKESMSSLGVGTEIDMGGNNGDGTEEEGKARRSATCNTTKDLACSTNVAKRWLKRSKLDYEATLNLWLPFGSLGPTHVMVLWL